tara:strand:- start:3457 stop:3861 length:405 start_codon:yes stop_codon:yes gene_type:complete
MVETATDKYVDWKLNQLNTKLDWSKVCRDCGIDKDDEKTICIITEDVGKVVTFRYGMGLIEMQRFQPESPTIIIRCTEPVFRAIIAGKLHPDEAFYGNLAKFEGSSLIREKIASNLLFDIIFGTKFDEYKTKPT